MIQSIRTITTATRGRRIGTLIVSASAFTLGIVLIVLALRGPTPPDPATADGETLTLFLAGDRFADLSSQQREFFFRGLTERYLAMSPPERADFEASWRKHRKSTQMRRQIEAQMALALIRRISDQYTDTPQDQRAFYLDGILYMLRATDGPLSREFRSWADGQPVQERLGDPEDLARGINNFKRDVLDGTNAGERATLSMFAGALLERARQNR